MKKVRFTFFVLLIVFTAAVLVACGSDRNKTISVGDAAPEFTAPDLNGETFSLKSFAGRPVILRFFQPDCPYCRADTAVFNKYYAIHRDKGLLVLYLSTAADIQELSDFAADLQLSFPLVPDTGGKISASYRIKAVPQTIILNRSHRIAEAILGGVTAAELDEVLASDL